MNKTNKYLLVPLGLLSMTALSGVLLMSNSVNADNDSVVDEINITVPVSCTLSGSGMTSHTASIPNGTYTDDIGTTTLKAFCNDSEGFAIYAVGYTGNEIGATNSTKLVGTSASNNATIDTGTATGPVSGNDTSNWAMKLQTVSSPTPTYPITIDNSFSNYSAVPSSYTKVAHRDNGTDIGQSAEGVSLTTTYAAYISKTQAADTYSGQVKYTLVHPSDAATPRAEISSINELTYMQDFSLLTNSERTNVLNSMTEGTQYQLMDSRDNKNYYISKLADGNVWMTQNLDLDLDTNTTYTHANTDLGWGAGDYSDTRTTWTPVSLVDSSHGRWCENGYSGDGDCLWYIPEYADPGDYYWNGKTYEEIDEDTEAWSQYNECINDGSLTSIYPCIEYLSAVSSTGNSHYHFGNYYNWTAAVAMNDNSPIQTGEEGEIVDQSICPAGWTLPRAGFGEDSFYSLFDEYNLNNLQEDIVSSLSENPAYLAPTSYPENLYSIGKTGSIWSSVPLWGNHALRLSWYEESWIKQVNSSTYSSFRGDGGSIRCITRPVSNILVMQTP